MENNIGHICHNKVTKKHITGVFIGTFMQWYDFSIFGSLAIIISSTFFSQNGQYNKLINFFLVFSVSFALAPLGAFFLGLVGDRYGRKKVLLITLIALAIPTFIIGILPSYSVIGILATILLVSCRLLQGFFSGVEFTSSAIYLVEISSYANKNFMGCLTSISYSFGSLVGALMAAICTMEIFPNWFWRIPFVLSFMGIAVAYCIRRQLPETVIFSRIKEKKKGINPIKLALKYDFQAMIITFLLSSTAGILAYGTFVWLISYLNSTCKFTISISIGIAIVAMITDATLEPIIAKYIDMTSLDSKKISVYGLFLLSILAYPLFACFSLANITLAFFCAFIFGTLIALICAPINTLMVLSYKPENRCSGFGISFNLGISILGGSAPLVLTFLSVHFGILYVSMYYILACIMGIVALNLIVVNDYGA